MRLGPEWPQPTTWTESTCEFLGVTTAFVLLILLGSFCSAIETQARILFKLKEHIKAEIGMHAAAGENHDSLTRMLLFLSPFLFAAVSPLGWKVVGFMEKNPELDKDRHGMDIEDLRAKEKQLMQHESTCFSSVSVGLSLCSFFLL